MDLVVFTFQPYHPFVNGDGASRNEAKCPTVVKGRDAAGGDVGLVDFHNCMTVPEFHADSAVHHLDDLQIAILTDSVPMRMSQNTANRVFSPPGLPPYARRKVPASRHQIEGTCANSET